jgi:DNA-binding NarL/FixJ family response regulator
MDDALTAARDALARHDWQAARDAAAAATVDTPALEAERLDALAEAEWWLGRLDECIEAREQAYRLFDELGEHRAAGQCAVWLWEHYAITARPANASAWLRRARRSLEGDTECAAYGALLLREAEVAHGSGDLERASGLATDVIVLARDLRSADLEAEALQTKGRVLIDQGAIADGMGHLDEAMLFAIEGRLGPFSTGKVYCSLISACEEVGDYDRAAEWTESTLKWADRHPFAIWPGVCRVHRAVVLKRQGELEEAEREAARACEELAHSHVANSAAAYAEVGDIRRRLGQLDESEVAFARAQEISGQACAPLALLRLAQGRVDAANAIVTSCVRNTTNPLSRASLLPAFVHVAIAAGDLDAARDASLELDQIVAGYANPEHAAAALSTRGRLQLADGDAVAAADTLRHAVERWRDLNVPYEIATAQTLLGQAAREAGDEDAATESFAAAAKLFDQIGARLDAQLLTDGAPAPVLPAGLTEREVEVLQLVAAGLTNNEIASALYLSAKTVSRHLSNIFTKIGVTSRAGATAFAFEHGLVQARS